MQEIELYFQDLIGKVLNQSDIIEKTTEKLAKMSIKRVYLCGCGGAISRLRCGKSTLISSLNVPVIDVHSSEFAISSTCIIDSETLVIIGSKTGVTDDLLKACERIQGRNATVIGFTGTMNCPVNRYLDVKFDSLDTDVNLFLYWLFILSLKKQVTRDQSIYDEYVSWLKQDQNKLCDFLKIKSTEIRTMIPKLSSNYQMWIGSGDSINILECYSKYIMEEIQRIPTQVIHSGEFFHGPFEIIDAQQCVFLLIDDQENRVLDIRVESFLDKQSLQYFKLDLVDYCKDGISSDLKTILNTILTNYYFVDFKAAYSESTQRSASTRRYYRVVEY